MPTTSNFGWTTPADTDLVKDGAAAIRTLGNGIDTSLVDLKGGTTGQILSKASNTDLDYTWINNDVGDITEVVAGTGISGGGTSGSVTITNTVATTFDAKGDLVVGTGADTFAKLTVGANGNLLEAASGQSTGLKWGNNTGFSLVTAGSFSGASSFSVDSVFGADFDYYKILLTNHSGSGSAAQIRLIFRTGGVDDTNASYYSAGRGIHYAGTVEDVSDNGVGYAFVFRTQGAEWAGTIDILNPYISQKTWYFSSRADTNQGAFVNGYFNNTTSFDGFKISNTGATNISGNYRVYGYRNNI